MKILIALPVYNEQLVLEKNTKALVEYCRKNITQHQFQIVICDNDSTDDSARIAQELVRDYPEVSYVFILTKGKGNAWRQAFLDHNADIYCMIDVDLATDLQALLPLVDGVINGNDLVIGSRFVAGATVEQSIMRSIISRTYIFLINLVFGTRFTDFQCGFKAISSRFRDEVLVKTRDNEFFLDTEMVLAGHRLKYKILEIPVQWSDFREPRRVSSVGIFSTVFRQLIKILIFRLK
jgi:glycosyltransferase involved in cell wall biosynthesis